MLQIKNLSKYYTLESGQKLAAVHDVTLDLSDSHHLISLIGPDGAGKSTLLKLIAGLLAPDDGQVTTAVPLTIGYMSQNLGLYEDLSVLENLRLFARLRDITPPSSKSLWQQLVELIRPKAAVPTEPADTAGAAASDGTDKAASEDTPQSTAELDAYLMDLLTQVGLAKFKDYKAGSLSGGMKQKLALTCAISARPQLLILDEPTVGVDPISRRELWQIIYSYVEQNNCYCIFSSLYLEEAEKSSMTIFMQHGQVIYSGSAQELKQQVAHQCFALSLHSHSYQKLARGLMCAKAQHSDSCLIDICPRLGRIDLLTKAGVSLEQLDGEIHRLVQLIPNFDQAHGASFSLEPQDYALALREPILEDAYINLTTKPDSKTTSLSSGFLMSQRATSETSGDKDAAAPSAPSTSAAPSAPDTHGAQDALGPKSSLGQQTSAAREAVIKVNKIKKQFGDFTAVHDSSFNVYKGEIFGLLGPNGAGKTTTFRMICALLNPSAGSILINGMSLQDAKSSVRATIGYVAQKFCLYRKMTLLQNLIYFGTSYGLQGSLLKERIEYLCTTFDLSQYKEELAGNLPFGVQRSLSMACALIHQPAILFLDEATSGADPTSRRTFWSLISQLAATGTTIIVTTHFMEEAEYCDRFLIQDQGKILILGTPDEICNQQPADQPDSGTQRISIEEAFIRCVEQQRQASQTK